MASNPLSETDQSHEGQSQLRHLLLVREIEEFLYAEAELLDEWRLEEWLDLLTEDVRYWMPIRRNVKYGERERELTREQQDVNWFDEGKATLRARVVQIGTGIHWAEEPLSRVCHLVSNVQLLSASESEVLAKCRFLVYRNRVETETDIFVGKREDTLRKVDGRWKLARRKILLDQNVLLPKNLTIIL